jgi:hypothetical protein
MLWLQVCRYDRPAIALGALLLVATLIFLWRAGARTRRATKLLGESTPHFDVGERVVVEGIVRSLAPLRTRIPPGAESPVRAVMGAETLPIEDAYLEVRFPGKDGPERLALDATAQIIVGTRERRDDSGSVGTLHTVNDGDPVVACGRLVRTADPYAEPGAAGYRDGRHGLALAGLHDGPPVLVARRRTWTAGVLLVLTAGVTLSVVGGADAVLVTEGRLRCGFAVDAALGRGDWTQADALAASCDDPLARAHASFARGQFAQAHASFVLAARTRADATPTVSEIQSASLAGDFDDAQRLTSALSLSWYTLPPPQGRSAFGCIADGFGSRYAGVATGGLLVSSAGSRLPDDAHAVCHFLAADLESTVDARMRALFSGDDALQTRRLLGLEAGDNDDGVVGRPWEVYFRRYPLPVALADPVAWLLQRHIALEDSVARELPVSAPIEHAMAAQAALFQALMGHREQALVFLEKTATPGGDRLDYIVGAIAAIFAGDRGKAERLLVLGAAASDAVGFLSRAALPTIAGSQDLPELSTSMEPWESKLFDALRARNVDKTVQALSEGNPRRVFDALRAIAYLRGQDLSPLRAWLRSAFPAPPWDHGVTEVGLTLGAQLLLAERLGDRQLAAQLRPRVSAFAAALTSRPGKPRLSDPSLVNDFLERTQDDERAKQR